jgi:hypothetical protein
MTDRHTGTPKGVRMPAGLLGRVKAAAATDGASVNGFIVAAIEEKLERRGSTTPADRVAPPRARSRKPREDTAPAVTFTAPLDSPNARIALTGRDDQDCPHPKARINKGLCGACGTYVGIAKGAQR